MSGSNQWTIVNAQNFNLRIRSDGTTAYYTKMACDKTFKKGSYTTIHFIGTNGTDPCEYTGSSNGNHYYNNLQYSVADAFGTVKWTKKEGPVHKSGSISGLGADVSRRLWFEVDSAGCGAVTMTVYAIWFS